MFEFIAGGMLAAMNHLDDAMLVIGVFTMLLLTLFGVALVLSARGRAAAFCQTVPTLLTTFGILGTFLGISTGLLHFDVANIEASIPLLLEGLKLAFVTSMTGILLAVILRFVLVLRPGSTAAHAAVLPGESASAAAFIAHQTQLADAQLLATHHLIERIAQLDINLIETLERQHTQQLAAFDRFAGQLSELGSRQLIAALESVVRDFNSNLGAQFGENFRRLDVAVERLLVWQTQYREHMDALGRQLDQALGGVAKSEESLQALTEQARQISCHIEDQATTMTGLRRESLELESLLASIAALRDRANDAFPAIDQRIKAMLESIENAMLAALSTQQRLSHYASSRPGDATPPELSVVGRS